MEKKKPRNVTQMNLYIRILAGGYVVYLAYDIFKMRDPQASNYWLMMLFVALFVIVGAGFVIMSVKSLIKKEYYDPNQDNSEEDEQQIVDSSAAEAGEVEINEAETRQKQSDEPVTSVTGTEQKE